MISGAQQRNGLSTSWALERASSVTSSEKAFANFKMESLSTASPLRTYLNKLKNMQTPYFLHESVELFSCGSNFVIIHIQPIKRVGASVARCFISSICCVTTKSRHPNSLLQKFGDFDTSFQFSLHVFFLGFQNREQRGSIYLFMCILESARQEVREKLQQNRERKFCKRDNNNYQEWNEP